MHRRSVALTRLLCLALVSLSLFVPSPAVAAVRRLCKVSYQTQYGWSSEHTMEVAFVTGMELNEAMHSFRFAGFSTYALLWFDPGEVAILKLAGFFIRSGDTFTAEDFRNLYYIKSTANFTQVNANYSRQWRIKAKDYISFIDPRETY